MQLHVIIGEDDYLVNETAKKIVGDGTGLELYDSRESTNGELQLKDLRRVEESVMTPPFFDPRKVTWWKNVNFLPGGKCSEDVKTALERFAERLTKLELPENQHFILSGSQMRKDTKFAKMLITKAEVVSFAADKPWAAEKNAVVRTIDYAEEKGLHFKPGAAESFVSVVGTDTRSIISELEKLRLYLGKERDEVSIEDIGEITSPGVKGDPVPWDLTDAVGARDLNQALKVMKRFELQNGFEVMMSGTLERYFRDLVDVKEGRETGLNPYVRQKMESAIKKWSLRELKIARARFLNLREKVVSGTEAGATLVVTELARAIGRKK